MKDAFGNNGNNGNKSPNGGMPNGMPNGLPSASPIVPQSSSDGKNVEDAYNELLARRKIDGAQ